MTVGALRKRLGGRHAGAFINKSVEELQKRLLRKGITVPRSKLRVALVEYLEARAGTLPNSIGAMLDRRFTVQRHVAAAEAEIAANLAEGRSRGGRKGSEAYRQLRRQRAERWWRLAGRMHGTLPEKARIIAELEKKVAIDPPSQRQVYEALRRYRPKNLT